ncbi:hypothetical protein V5P93_000264 [Actinokineospora auranticolor]|uniref:Uncharacterized protein n=1 Tax=Actinokineospora auranticolor TaxID=155976 RepID=A0A2S6GL23_9PSEU|nr:hypothetical protein [Actinokineospora auranticolor]PPK65846.1 hypothetical protein CLV40_112108 [Actinokineospora auranticolor]
MPFSDEFHTKVIAAWHARKWIECDSGPGHFQFLYPRSFGVLLSGEHRVWLADIGVETLDCVIRQGRGGRLTAELNLAGVTNGCDLHRRRQITNLTVRKYSPMRLSWYEREAREIDRVSLSQCVMFGTCREAVSVDAE